MSDIETMSDVSDDWQFLLDQIPDPLASLIGDGAYVQADRRLHHEEPS